ncbi:unnamed protein product, partial [Discosporangium mesarthrocarpum]
RLWALNKDDIGWLALGFFGAILAGGAFPSEGVFVANVQANLYKTDVDRMRREGNLWAIGFVILGLVAFIGHFCLATGFAVAGERLTRILRKMVFESMVR